LLGTGKVMVDIEEEIAKSDENFDWLRAMRVEQLYPFPTALLKEELDKLTDLEEIVWVQEEPQNMGGRLSVVEYLREIAQDKCDIRYIRRTKIAATAVGEHNNHKINQHKLVEQANK